MRPGDVVTSRRHKGLIRLVVVYTNGGGIGKKLKKDGTPSRREVVFGPGDIMAVRQTLPGCGNGGRPKRKRRKACTLNG